MAIHLGNIALDLDEPEDLLLAKAAARLKIPTETVAQYAVVRRSLDARRGRPLQFVYSMEMSLHEGEEAESRCLRRLHGRHASLIAVKPQVPLETGDAPLPHRPVVVGFGPAGMFAALILAEYGYKPIVLERGREVRRRHKDVFQTFYREGIFDPESNLLFGEGGAGTYSDGKVNTRLSDPKVQQVLACLCRFGADPRIMIDNKPHIGSNRIPTICGRIRRHMERLGAEVRFETRVDDFEVSDGRLTGIRTGDEVVDASAVLLGIGHSARDTFSRLLSRGIQLESKPFQFGVRIEHPQEMVNRWQYEAAAEHPRLPAADYRLVAKGAAGESGDLFSFCMCPGGTILPTMESPGLMVTNGGSNAQRSGHYANSAFVITIDPYRFGDDPLAGVEFQRKWERMAFAATGGSYRVPAQRCVDFLEDRGSDGTLETSHPIGAQWTNVSDILPEEVRDALKRGLAMLNGKMPGFAGGEGIITAPESRAGVPIRITRDRETRESVSTPGLYPIGEGAGFAGGIISAAIDGMRSAEKIIRRYKPI